MNKDLRKSGITTIGDVPWGTHICQFYRTKEDLLDTIIPYFKAGLENNEFCLWVVSEPLKVEDTKAALRKSIQEIETYLEIGQMEIILFTDWFTTEGVFDCEKVTSTRLEKLNYALENGYDGMRLSGNTSWLEKDSWDDFIKFKEQTDKAMGSYELINLCTYPLDNLNAAEIIDVVVNHQFALIKRENQWKRMESAKLKQAEAAAVQATKNWEQTLDILPDPIAVMDTDYRIVRVNRAMAARLGAAPEELIGKTCYSVVHGTSEPPSFCPHLQMLKDGLEHTSEVHEDLLGGDFIVSVSPLHDSEGKLSGCIHVARDITKRKKAEEALRESEKRERTRSEELEAVLDAVPVAVYIARDPRVSKIIGNRLSYEWLQLPRGSNFSKSAPEGERPDSFKLFKDGVEIPPEKMPSQAAAAGIEINDCELDIVSADGKIRHVLGNARPLRDEQGNIRGSISAFIDITGRKKAEEALKQANDNLENLVKKRTAELEQAFESLKEKEASLAEAQKMAHLGNWDRNLVTGETYWSDEMCRIYGRNPAEPAPTYDEFLNYVHPGDRGYVDNAIKKALNGETFGIEFRIVSTDGNEHTVHAEVEVTFDRKNIPVRVRGTVQDITERKLAENFLANIETARKKEIHHRIKNNLQVISSLLDLQSEKFRDRECVEDDEVLSAFRESQDRVMSIALIHEELHEGRGNDTLNFSPYLERLAKNLFQTYRLGNTNTNLNIELDEDIFFDMDTAVPLGIIINELVSNSLKYAFRGKDSGLIQIKLCREKSQECSGSREGDIQDHRPESVKAGHKGTSFVLTVSDNGIGIPENCKSEKSSSLGLQLVMILIDQLGGKLELKRDSGTQFVIRFSVSEMP